MNDERLNSILKDTIPTKAEIEKMDLKEAWKIVYDYCAANYAISLKLNGISALYGEDRNRYVAMLRLTFEIDKILEKEKKNEKF